MSCLRLGFWLPCRPRSRVIHPKKSSLRMKSTSSLEMCLGACTVCTRSARGRHVANARAADHAADQFFGDVPACTKVNGRCHAVCVRARARACMDVRTCAAVEATVVLVCMYVRV